MDVIQYMDRVLPPDVIITNGAGNYDDLGVSVPSLSRLPHAAGADSPGAMGYGVPAGIAAQGVVSRGVR